jgi:hypothetical protein
MTVGEDEPASAAPTIGSDALLALYEQMEVIRRTEKAAHCFFLAGLVKGTTHLAAVGAARWRPSSLMKVSSLSTLRSGGW